MKKQIYVEEDVIRIIEHKPKFLSFEIEENEIKVPVHLIKLVQKAYDSNNGTMSIAIFLETEDEFFVTYEEVDNIDLVFDAILDLKERTNKFRVELYNIETQETIDK